MEGKTVMRIPTFTPALGSLLAVLALAPAAIAQTAAADPQAMPSIEMESTSASVGIGTQSGKGILRLPNLGTNCSYPFTVSGFGAGIQVGISRASAAGVVANMARVSDIAGNYSATQGEATLLAGAGSTNMKNQGNNVAIGLKSRTEGLALGIGGSGMAIQLTEPPVSVQKSYYLSFGFGKSHLNRESRAALDQVVRAWKCHYGTILLFGNSDTVGKESSNLNISELRAIAARDYLISAGFNPARLAAQPKGETNPYIATGKNVRLRTNRNVVVVVKE
jgi:outer membrane protein OmpA-like peptidoglycan-associated protein